MNKPLRTNASKYSLTAYKLGGASMRLQKAAKSRDWMDNTPERFAYRCLPLLIANQAGWFVLNNRPLRAIWDGGNELSSVVIESLDEEPVSGVSSHFGQGILTWQMPYLFRTSPGFNLLVKGPSNHPKDGIYALEGIVETDWAVATFTMNWKFTRKNKWISWAAEEPVCMVAPQQRNQLEKFRVQIQPLSSDNTLNKAFNEWRQSRQSFLEMLKTLPKEKLSKTWQKHYFSGEKIDGIKFSEHQTNLNLHDFTLDEKAGAQASICPFLTLRHEEKAKGRLQKQQRILKRKPRHKKRPNTILRRSFV